MPQQLLFLELNEINFESVAYYGARGKLPHLYRLINEQGVQTTTSEHQYEHIEPWIQWVTAHTGLTLAEHGVLRLGDVVTKDIPQIWELLEAQGITVGAVSPMNAKHRLRDPAFFIPDPWTPTNATCPALMKQLYRAIAQAVNDNAQGRISLASLGALLTGLLRYARASNYSRYFSLVAKSRGAPWKKAIFLDLLLADLFVERVRATRPQFATLFLNAGAHIQHHYMFNSTAYGGERCNPHWYVPAGVDPVLEVYELYDHILGDVRRAFAQARLMLATGLHQVPHTETTFYWRLRDHAAFLRKVGIAFRTVEARMSRDFLLTFDDSGAATTAARYLAGIRSKEGVALFEVDNRGSDLFVMLVWPHDIPDEFEYELEGRRFAGLKQDVAFVAIKNGEHSGIGYFLDTGADSLHTASTFPLHEMPARIWSALDLPLPSLKRATTI